MAIYGNPIYDRAEEASFFAEYFASFIGNGVYPNPSVGMQVIANGGLELLVQPGKCFIKGYFGVVEEGGETVRLESSDTSYNRIDRVVARLTIEERKIKLAVLKGIPASTPVATDLTRNSNIYEICLADVAVNKNASVITQANITDTRLNSSICGIVSGVIEQVDTTTLFEQYKKWFEEQQSKANTDYQKWFDGFTIPSEEEFTNWFNNIKEKLSEDAAGNLQNQINDLKTHASVAVGEEEPNNKEDIWFRTKSQNLYDENQSFQNTAIDSYGTFGPQQGYNVSNYINVKAGDILSVCLKKNDGVTGSVEGTYANFCFYDDMKRELKAYPYTDNNFKIVVNQNGYFRISHKIFYAVEAYKNVDATILVKDQQGYKVFAKFYDNKVYSENEILIGVTDNGENVYSKTYHIPNIAGDGVEMYLNPGIKNLHDVFDVCGGFNFKAQGIGSYIPFNLYNFILNRGTFLYFSQRTYQICFKF